MIKVTITLEVMTEDDGSHGVIASVDGTNLVGMGDTDEQALADLTQNIRDTQKFFSEHEGELAEDAEEQLEWCQDYLGVFDFEG